MKKIILTVAVLLAVIIPAQAGWYGRKKTAEASKPKATTAETRQHKEAVIRLQRAEEYLREIQKTNDAAIPSELFAECRGIIILRQYKAGFIIGAKGGRGVALVKDEKTGAWSPPAFIATAEGSIGWQIGGQSIDTIFLVMNQEGVEMLLKTKFKIGVDASAAAGPVGRDASAKAGIKTALVAYSRSKGLFAGMSIEGGMLVIDGAAHEAMYGDAKATVNDILITRTYPMPKEAEGLIKALEEYSVIAKVDIESRDKARAEEASKSEAKK